MVDSDFYIVGCRGVVQLGGLVLGSPGLVPLRLRLASFFFSLRSTLVFKIKNTWFILFSQPLLIYHFAFVFATSFII